MSKSILAPAAGATSSALPVEDGVVAGTLNALMSPLKSFSEPTKYIDESTVGKAVAIAFIGGTAVGGRFKDKLPTLIVGQ